MRPEDFIDQLRREGYAEIVTVEREPYGDPGEHAHDFEAKALILAGEITLVVAGKTICCRAGDTFHLPAGTKHGERYGAEGVRYLVGRR